MKNVDANSITIQHHHNQQQQQQHNNQHHQQQQQQQQQHNQQRAKYIIWSRIDQKSCFKSILIAGYIPLIVDPIIIINTTSSSSSSNSHTYELKTDIKKINSLLLQYQHEILCVLSTTSCFAPRQPDNIDEIVKDTTCN